MTDTDKVIQVAASRIQGLTRQVNHWKDRTEELEAALGIEKAARISAEATRDRALNAGAANVELQEELQKERAEHQETCRYLADAQAKVRDLLSERDGLFARLRQSIAHGDFAGIALAEAHGAIWGLGCEMTNLRCDFATARDERDRALGKWVDEKVSQVFDCTTDFLRAEIADLRRTFDAVHYALGIKSGDNIIQAINKLVRERNCAKEEWERAEERCKGLVKDIEVLRIELRESQNEAVTERKVLLWKCIQCKKLVSAHESMDMVFCPKCRHRLEAVAAEIDGQKQLPRSHPVKVGEWVERTEDEEWSKAGDVRMVQEVAQICIPCDPPEATHDTPEGQEMAQAAVTPQPEDKVRLVRVPTKQDCKEYDYTDPEQRRLVERRLHTTGTVLAGKHECGCLKVQMAHSAFVKAWPQSCIEIVDAK